MIAQIFAPLLSNLGWIVLLFVAITLVKFFKPFLKGKIGEFAVSTHVKLYLDKENYILLNDCTLPDEQNQTTQIDHILLSPYGIFVIETKNYKGWIFGHENSEEWKQSLLGKKRFWGWSSEQHKFRNPIRQNEFEDRYNLL